MNNKKIHIEGETPFDITAETLKKACYNQEIINDIIFYLNCFLLRESEDRPFILKDVMDDLGEVVNGR